MSFNNRTQGNTIKSIDLQKKNSFLSGIDIKRD